MSDITALLPFFQLILAICNIAIIGYGFYKFLGKPHDDIKDRISDCELEIKEIKRSLDRGEDNFKAQDDTNEVLIHSIMALIEFEIQYCLTEKKPMSKDLEKAKDDLHSYLAKK